MLHAAGDTAARAARRRQRIIGRVPEPLRPAVAAFSAAELANRERARRVGARILTDQTLAVHLDIVADFAANCGLNDWATAATPDIEKFLAARSPAGSHVLPSLRAFFGWARSQRVVLVDPTRALRNTRRTKYSGPIVDLDTQRRLFRRWRSNEVHPNEALIGLLAMIHGASVHDLRCLRVNDIDSAGRSIVLASRPQPVPLDPVTWAAAERVLAHRRALPTDNPHLIVNRRTRVSDQPMSVQHAAELLEPLGVTPRRLRCSRLAQLITTTDPVMIAEIFGITSRGALYYLADSVDDARLAQPVDAQAPPATR
jgi:site-specific recombinase XerC